MPATTIQSTEIPARVLLVEDDQSLRSAYERCLVGRGFSVQTARDGLEAKEIVERASAAPFDVILTDVMMPGYGGLPFLRAVRQKDREVAVILMTGRPTVESSMTAVEYGAFRYLVKPFTPQLLEEVVKEAAGAHKTALLKRRALEILGNDGKWLGDRDALERHFGSALQQLWMAFQPIVSWRDQTIFAYEALLRSDERTLAGPLEFLEAGERLDRLHAIGRAARAKVASHVGQIPRETKLFVNLHAADLFDDDLHDTCAGLTGIAHRVVLELTERECLVGKEGVVERVKNLKRLGFRIAIDDLGAGYAGLASFAHLEPDFAKLDMSLISGIDKSRKQQCVVRSMISLCEELGVEIIAEGIETKEERDVVASLGAHLMQGYFFAKPGRGFPQPRW